MARNQVPTRESTLFNILDTESDYDHGTSVKDEMSEDENDEVKLDYSEEEEEAESEEDEDEVSPEVQADIARFEDSFKDLTKQYRIIDRIGEGTFSTVYKAEDLLYDHYLNDWDIQSAQSSWVSPPVKKTSRNHPQPAKPKRYVAIKKIYVTSSPLRIQNELELLKDLRNCRAICPLITAARHHDQVVAVLPYYRHQDFREYYRSMTPSDMAPYFRALFTALAAVHRAGILHRDIKPTNFLYNFRTEHGVLVDFGLAEREGTDASYCLCSEGSAMRRRSKVESSYAFTHPDRGSASYPKSDTRPSRRANRAGTRGFRAPEVLFKCTSQTTKIDVWSVGVILLTILARRFPFFNSSDDIEAMIEISSIFGRRKMKACAELHGTVFECNIPTVGERGFTFERLIPWARCQKEDTPLDDGDKLAISLLEKCLDLDPRKRISAKDALNHPFLQQDEGEGDEEMSGVDFVD